MACRRVAGGPQTWTAHSSAHYSCSTFLGLICNPLKHAAAHSSLPGAAAAGGRTCCGGPRCDRVPADLPAPSCHSAKNAERMCTQDWQDAPILFSKPCHLLPIFTDAAPALQPSSPVPTLPPLHRQAASAGQRCCLGLCWCSHRSDWCADSGLCHSAECLLFNCTSLICNAFPSGKLPFFWLQVLPLPQPLLRPQLLAVPLRWPRALHLPLVSDHKLKLPPLPLHRRRLKARAAKDLDTLARCLLTALPVGKGICLCNSAVTCSHRAHAATFLLHAAPAPPSLAT